MKAVLFGAGNIGRGFIGLTLARSGFEIVFVDIEDRLVAALRERKAYDVELAGTERRTERVERVTAIHGRDRDAVAEAIAEAGLVATAIGAASLQHIAETLAEGIRRRIARSAQPLPVIACENAIGSGDRLQRYVAGHLSEEEKTALPNYAVFPNAAVDRIVPARQHEDPLAVTVEPFAEWVVDRTDLPPGSPLISGVIYVDDLEPYISRKLFTVNTGHCTAAYHGYLRKLETIQQVMQDASLRDQVRSVLEETGAVLCRMYAFDQAEHRAYIATTLERFSNPHLTDDVVRVGRSPIRKLSPDDRLVKPAMLAFRLGIPAPHLTDAIVAALQFDYEKDPEAVQLQQALNKQGIRHVVAYYLGIPADHPLHEELIRKYENIGGERT